MAKTSPRFVCQACGSVTSRWAGRCEACGEWNTIAEEPAEDGPRYAGSLAGSSKSGAVGSSFGGGSGRGRVIELAELTGETAPPPRVETGMAELDRVTGGGLVPGSALLVGGDPGIGKSTVLLQAAAQLALKGARAIYISGEEAADQVRLRAERLGLAHAPVALAAETNLRDILATLKAEKTPPIVVLDSIQTLWSDTLEAAPGTVSQVRACAAELVRFGKDRGATIILVGHVTKDGQIAGPKVVEHMVDTVLYFEGERGHHFRILRAVKNRFGPTDEIGVFEMTGRGLIEVANPSALFLGRDGQAGEPVPGSAVFAGIEGTRPLLVEIQALVTETRFGTPRRAVVGWDGGRLAMVLAVLEARAGVEFGAHDVYLNVAGGLRIGEPAADLAVAAALLSARLDVPLPREAVVFGELSLAGSVRPVTMADARLKEAAKLGFKAAFAPAGAEPKAGPIGLQLLPVGTAAELLARIRKP
jgi:DNA repair protein RadA/Sms